MSYFNRHHPRPDTTTLPERPAPVIEVGPPLPANTHAIWGFTLASVGFCILGFLCIVALPLCIIGLSRANRREVGNRRLALAGVWIAAIGAAGWTLLMMDVIYSTP